MGPHPFTEALLGAHLIWGGPIPGGPDAFVREWAQTGTIMGVTDPPTTAEELETARRFQRNALLRRPRTWLCTSSATPAPRLIGAAYPVLYAAALASMPSFYLDLLRLRTPRWPAITTTRTLFGAVRVILRPTAPGAAAAQARIKRLNQA